MELSKNDIDRVNVWKKSILEGVLKTSNGLGQSPKPVQHDEKFNWFFKHHKRVHDFIISNYTNLNSQRSHLSTLAKMYKVFKGTYSYLYRKYSNESIKLQKKIENESLDQKISDHRKYNYITIKQIEQQRDILEKSFHEFSAKNKTNLQYLLLCLYTLQPPLRQDYKNMLIVHDKVPNKKDNFLLKKQNKYFIVIQHDKVIRQHGPATLQLNDQLNTIIDESLSCYPRHYLISLVSCPDKPMSKHSFETLLKECFQNKNIGVDLIRSAYITDKYNNKTLSMRQKEDLALKMRNSVRVAQTIYHKIEPISEDVKEEQKDDNDNIDYDNDDIDDHIGKIMQILNINSRHFGSFIKKTIIDAIPQFKDH